MPGEETFPPGGAPEHRDPPSGASWIGARQLGWVISRTRTRGLGDSVARPPLLKLVVAAAGPDSPRRRARSGEAFGLRRYKKARAAMRWKWVKKRTRRLQKRRRKMRQRSK